MTVWAGAGAEAAPLEVSFEQAGHRVPLSDARVELEPGPFVVVVRSPPDVLLVSASTEPSTWRAAVDHGPLSAMPGFAGTGIAEAPGNKNQAIFVRSDAPNAWTSERFDRCEPDAGGARVCRRTIARAWAEPEGEPLPTELYLVFAETSWTPTYERVLHQAIPVRVHFRGPPTP